MGGPGYLGGGTATGGYSETENIDSKKVVKISQNVDTTDFQDEHNRVIVRPGYGGGIG